MPELGEIRHANDIGKATGWWKYTACYQCGITEWKRTTKNPTTRTPSEAKVCRQCNIDNQKRTFMVAIYMDNK